MYQSLLLLLFLPVLLSQASTAVLYYGSKQESSKSQKMRGVKRVVDRVREISICLIVSFKQKSTYP